MKIFIGIATYNRLEILKKMSLSLSQLKGIESCIVSVHDDCSIEFGIKELNSFFPNARITVNKKNLGADVNTSTMYHSFLESDADVFFNADSDMLFHTDSLSFIKDVLPKTQGIISLYNSNKHLPKKKLVIDGMKFVLKNDAGAAGVAFTRKILQDILNNVEVTRSFDWDWSKYLAENNIPIFVPQNSYAQHIGGIIGANSFKYKFDFGLGFNPSDTLNRGLLLDYLYDMKHSSVLWKRHHKWIKYQLKILGVL